MKHLLLCIVPLILLVYVAQDQTIAQQDSPPVPANWSMYPKPASGGPDMRCGNYSKRSWFVSLENEELKIATRAERSDSPGTLPFRLRLPDSAGGHRVVHQLDDGWLVGFEAGEWGGSLWWFSADGKRRQKLSSENIVYFVKLSSEVLALGGLNHMSIDTGKALTVKKDRSGRYRAQLFANLDGEPAAYVQETPDSVLILTTQGVRRLKSSASIEKLVDTDIAILYPTSMALTKQGVIYLGMRHYIVRLIPTGNGYKEEWFVPNDCRKFEIRNYECACM